MSIEVVVMRDGAEVARRTLSSDDIEAIEGGSTDGTELFDFLNENVLVEGSDDEDEEDE